MLHRAPLTCAAPAALLALLSVTARAEGVHILQAPGLGPLPDIQTAVDAAADGDVLLVAPGVYLGFVVDDRSLWIVASEPGAVSVTGTVTVRNTTLKDVVVMIGIDATGMPQDIVSDPGLVLDGNKGHLRFQQCTFTGGKGTNAFVTSLERGAGGAGVHAYDNKRAAFVRCALQGGTGGGKEGLNYSDEGGDGGPGVHAELSAVVLYDSSSTGGPGGVGGAIGGDGGHGYWQIDFGVVAANCAFTGADGGYAWDVLPWTGGNGGDALRVELGGQAQLVDNTYLRGNPGGSCCGGALGSGGEKFAGGGVFNKHAVPARSFQAEPLASDGELWGVETALQPGDVAFLFWAPKPSFQVPSPVWGVQLALPTVTFAFPAVPVGGTLPAPNLNKRLPEIVGQGFKRMYWQGLALEGGVLQPCSPLHLLVLDRQGLPDCDGDGVNDFLAVIEGLRPDCNRNLVPDSCDITALTDPDCNANGIPDSCDIETGFSPDINANGIPDECEQAGVVWHVDDDAPPGGNGTAGSPFQAIGHGVAAALSGDTVLVADGTYTGPDNRNVDFLGRDLIVVSQNGPAATTIDLQLSGRAFLFYGGETTAARVDGFTIRNGSAPGGGAIAINQAGPTIADCVFDGNKASSGGAISASGSGSTRVTGCTFVNNSATTVGGAIRGFSQPRFIDGCLFLNDSSGSSGGAVDLNGGPATITHCEFTGNTSKLGAALRIGSSDPILVAESLFTGNVAQNRGGAINVRSTDLRFSGLTIAGNSAVNSGGGLNLEYGEAVLADSVLWGNSAPTGGQISLMGSASDTSVLWVDYSCVQNGSGGVHVDSGHVLQWGVGNLESDPLFVAPGSDYRLGPGSPCIDAGDVTAVAPDQLDLNGNGNTTEPVPYDLDLLPRFQDDPLVPDTGNGPPPIVDMGAYEKQG